MDILKAKTVTSVSGGNSINVGLAVGQILGILRQGEQKDKTPFVSLSLLNGNNWVFIPPTRISFGSSYPLIAGEKIRILYKVTI